MSMEEKLELRVHDSLLTLTDHMADNLGTNRSDFVRQAIEDYLHKQFEQNEGMKEILVEDYLSGEVPFSELRRLLDFEDAQAIRATKEAFDRSDDVIADIADEL